jgi:hypothetical protein
MKMWRQICRKLRRCLAVSFSTKTLARLARFKAFQMDQGKLDIYSVESFCDGWIVRPIDSVLAGDSQAVIYSQTAVNPNRPYVTVRYSKEPSPELHGFIGYEYITKPTSYLRIV